jgi:glycine/D-amino acid oxidase-like deaminating enzyme/nitrite reductase/ring-hydroxylating ferredoxin subunit
MEANEGATQSLWMKTSRLPRRSRLAKDARADVCIVGGGIAGLTTAYLLAGAGKSVIVLEAGQIGSGETGRTTAHLVSVLDKGYDEIERLHGEQGARMAAQSHVQAIDQIEAIVRQEGIDCQFERVNGYLFLAPGHDPGVLDCQRAAAHKVGLSTVERIARAPLSSLNTGPCLRFPRQGQFHPLKYLAGLAKAIEGRGGRIHTGSRAKEIHGGPQAHVKTDGGKVVTSKAVVVATNTPVNDDVTIHTKQAAYRTYAIGMRVPRKSVPRGLYWDTLDPYHYIRLQSGVGEQAGDVLIVGGEDHKTGQADDTEERFDRLFAWTRERFPKIRKPAYTWSGQVMEPVDGLAYIGRNPGDESNVYIATGDAGIGMTHGTIAGLILTDLICDRQNPWAALYEPSRVTLRAAKEFARANLHVTTRYADFLASGEITSFKQLSPGSGGVLRDGLHKVAVYRDEQGKLHKRSAVCPHLGCVVGWNSAEKTWDCPCHGSRFDGPGKLVLNGPALGGLRPPE